MQEDLLKRFESLSEEDQAFVMRLLDAKIRSNQSPLAYVEEVMSFQQRGQEEDYYLHSMVVRPELANRYGLLHGGILSTFIDTAMGSTCFMVNGITHKTVTLDLQVKFLKEAKVNSTLTSKSRIQKNGRTIIVLESYVYDQNGSIIGSATGTFFKMAVQG